MTIAVIYQALIIVLGGIVLYAFVAARRQPADTNA